MTKLRAGLVVAMGLALVARAEDPAPPDRPDVGMGPGAPMDQQEHMRERMAPADSQVVLQGRIEDLDERRGRLTLELQAGRGVNVFRDGRSVAFEALREGDSVRATYDEETGRVVGIDAISKARRERLGDEAREEIERFEE